jgi:hypothetical protein
MSAQRWLDGDGAGLASARPAQIGGLVAGGRSPRQPARSAAVDPSPGCRLGAGELFARVVSSSVTANRRRADQGGRHARMVVGADYPDRAGLGGVRDAGPSSPLTPPRHRPGHGWRSCSTRATAWRRGRCAPAQRAPPTAHRCPARQARCGTVAGASAARPPPAARWRQGRSGGPHRAARQWRPGRRRGQRRPPPAADGTRPPAAAPRPPRTGAAHRLFDHWAVVCRRPVIGRLSGAA